MLKGWPGTIQFLGEGKTEDVMSVLDSLSRKAANEQEIALRSRKG
jgi:hypothetical protein